MKKVLVSEAGATVKMLNVSTGNRKMNKGFLIWNIPAVKTCPGCTKICATKCYARKAEIAYPDALPSRERNLEDAKMESFADDMIYTIGRKVRRSKTFKGFFRVHESGDFFNQEYLDAWKRIASAFPSIKFLAFTKSFHLDYSDIPANLQIVMSIMPDTTKTPVAGFRKAYAGECANMNADTTIECPGLCDGCGMCWDLSRIGMDVHFDMH